MYKIWEEIIETKLTDAENVQLLFNLYRESRFIIETSVAFPLNFQNLLFLTDHHILNFQGT